jgi:hypothetical protein
MNCSLVEVSSSIISDRRGVVEFCEELKIKFIKANVLKNFNSINGFQGVKIMSSHNRSYVFEYSKKDGVACSSSKDLYPENVGYTGRQVSIPDTEFNRNILVGYVVAGYLSVVGDVSKEIDILVQKKLSEVKQIDPSEELNIVKAQNKTLETQKKKAQTARKKIVPVETLERYYAQARNIVEAENKSLIDVIKAKCKNGDYQLEEEYQRVVVPLIENKIDDLMVNT